MCLCESSAFPQLYNIVIFQHKWTIQSWTFASLCAAGGSESGRNARRAVGDLDRLKGRCSASRQWVLMSRKPCSQASANTCPNLSQCPPATHTSPAPLTGALAPGQRWVWVGKLGSGLGEIVLIWQEIKMQIVTRNSKELISHFLKRSFSKLNYLAVWQGDCHYLPVLLSCISSFEQQQNVSQDFLRNTKVEFKVAHSGSREGPAVWYPDGTLFVVCFLCSGWALSVYISVCSGFCGFWMWSVFGIWFVLVILFGPYDESW